MAPPFLNQQEHETVILAKRCWVCLDDQYEDNEDSEDYMICSQVDHLGFRCCRWMHIGPWNEVEHPSQHTVTGKVIRSVICWHCQNCIVCREVLQENFFMCISCDVYYCKNELHPCCRICDGALTPRIKAKALATPPRLNRKRRAI